MEELEGSLEILFRGMSIPCWLFASVVLLSANFGPVVAVHDFTAHRMQHFDLQGVHYGSRSAVINMEVKGETASLLNRKCVVVRWSELTAEKFLDFVHRGAGALIVLVPHDVSGVDAAILEAWQALESDLLSLEVPIPIYFAYEDETLLEMFSDLNSSAERDRNSSVAALLYSTVSGYSYQMVTEIQKETQPVKDTHFTTLMAKLTGQGLEHKLPTVALLAHYDAMSLATTFSGGAYSSASGVTALLEIARLLSRLYNDPKQRPKYNVVFVLSGAGSFNYFGTKNILDDQLDDPDSSLLTHADYTLCLDGLGSQDFGHLYIHVSKPPKVDSQAYNFLQALNQSGKCLDSGFELKLIHKKIRLSEELLAWEHERFSLKKLPAATISTYPNHKDHRRNSIFVTRTLVSEQSLVRNIRIVANAIAQHIYSIPAENATSTFEGSTDINKNFVTAWLHHLSSTALSPQLLNQDHPVVVGLEDAFSRYTHQVVKTVHRPDKSDPEIVTYDCESTKVTAYRVKPAVFDLFLAIAIVVYSAVWYLSITFFPLAVSHISTIPFMMKVKTTKLD